jgi:glycosyltransferase involved in cell wall biosynthesis
MISGSRTCAEISRRDRSIVISGPPQLSSRQPLNLFYEEPNPDRWVPFDRYPRTLLRRFVRGPWQPGGQMRVFLNLMAGLDRLGVSYRVNDYRYIRANRDELACLIGKPHILSSFPRRTPLLFGTSIYNHPIDDEGVLSRHTIRQFLVPSPWVKRMFSQIWPGLVTVWPIGVDTERWKPAPSVTKDVDIVVYDKVFRYREKFEDTLINPLLEELRRRGLVVERLRYGSYKEPELYALSRRTKAMIYLSRHETQGIALQQMLASDVPVLAWDMGGDWQTIEYLLRGVRFGPVTSVPYWDDRCGVKFTGAEDMVPALDKFLHGIKTGAFAPREMILGERLTLEGSAQAYVGLATKYGAMGGVG